MNSAAEVLVQKRLLMGIAPVDAIGQQDLRFPVRVDLETITPHLSALREGQYSHRQYALTDTPKVFPDIPLVDIRYIIFQQPAIKLSCEFTIYTAVMCRADC
jgi:hypothetical protein